MLKKLFIICFLLFLGWDGFAQKRVLDTTAYKQWRRVDAQNMSDDGKWVTYQLIYLDGESNPGNPVTYLHYVDKKKTYSLENVVRPTFFNDGKWLRYTVSVPEGENTESRKDSTFLLRLRDMKKIYWDRDYDFSESVHSAWVTYSYPIGEKGKEYKRLVLWNVETGDSTVRDSVGNYMFTGDDQAMVYVKNKDGHKSLFYQTLKGKPVVIFDDPHVLLKDYSLRRNDTRGTFVVASDSSRIKNPNLLYSFSIPEGKCKFLIDFDQIRLPEGYSWRGRAYRVSNDGKRVIIDVDSVNRQIKREKGKKDTRFELELWTWNDEESSLLQRAGNYNPCNIKFVYNLETQSCYRITSQNMEKLILPSCDQYEYAFGIDPSPYKRFADWKSDVNADIYIINMNNGETTLFEKNAFKEPEWSPDGKNALWYSALEKNWYKINPATGQRVNISKGIGYPVHNELHDLPKPADAYGIAGWTKEGDRVIIYDSYDLWVVDLWGKKKTYSLTHGLGRSSQRRFRWIKNDYNDKIIDLQNDILLHSVNLETKDEGIFRFMPDRKLKKLIEGSFALTIYQKSGNQKYCLFTRQSYTEFRDLWWSDLNFSRPVRLTEANPQQKEYLWGSAKLVKWTNYEGKENAGLLYLPEDYDPGKRYPVVVNFYETHTEGLHTYVVPALSSAMINPVSYASNGYIVFMPDVHFTVGNPGESSYNAIVSGTQMLIDRGIADKGRIGIQGHSWSGYQVAYLVTRTNIFKCASPGAAVSNMVSAYTGIRQGSGMPRMFMYEETQSRMGKSLWEDKEMYLRHSPILQADKIKTPMLIFHCDEDEAVPYSEGLNLFLAMRRLQKPAWLLNYKGERHFLYNRAAETDWTIRMQQFFDCYLKGMPMPRWMKEGIHASERGFDQKYDY